MKVNNCNHCTNLVHSKPYVYLKLILAFGFSTNLKIKIKNGLLNAQKNKTQ